MNWRRTSLELAKDFFSDSLEEMDLRIGFVAGFQGLFARNRHLKMARVKYFDYLVGRFYNIAESYKFVDNDGLLTS